jgi:hypothetical protein
VKRHKVQCWNSKVVECFLIGVTAFKIFFEINMEGLSTFFKQGRNVGNTQILTQFISKGKDKLP